MTIEATQYNALYTINLDGEILIREYTKHSSPKIKDQITWYESDESGAMIPIQDKNELTVLEEEFKSILG